MGFRGENYLFESPGAAVAGMISRITGARSETRSACAAEACPLDMARGRVLAEDVTADRDSPPFDYSSMDGYAVRVADLARALALMPTGAGHANPATFTVRVAAESRIGAAPPPLPLPAYASEQASVVRIVTGAPIPAGADAVLKREDVVELADTAGRVNGGRVTAITVSARAAAALVPGMNLRHQAENARSGSVVLESGTVLTPAGLGTLAAVGCAMPRMCVRVRVAVITTGDEVVAADQSPSPYQIRNSNGPAVSAALVSHAWLQVVSVEHVADDGEALTAALRRALQTADAVVLTGGVSMGHYDPVRGAVEAVGAEIVFHGLPQRPGKPMLGAVVRGQGGAPIPIFGLPGNPLSALVTCTRIVIPVLSALGGVAQWPPAPRIALANPDGKTLDLWWHRLVRIDEQGAAHLVDLRGSGDMIAGGRADGFIEVPPTGHTPNPPTDLLPFYRWPN